MAQKVWDRFSIIFFTKYTLQDFGESLNLSKILSTPQENCRLRLIINLYENPDSGTPFVNDNA